MVKPAANVTVATRVETNKRVFTLSLYWSVLGDLGGFGGTFEFPAGRAPVDLSAVQISVCVVEIKMFLLM